MVDQPRKLSLPPGYQPPRRGLTRWQIIRRRLIALFVLGGLVGVLYLVVNVALDRGSHTRSTTTTLVKPFKIVFPEGFTRRAAHRYPGSTPATARRGRWRASSFRPLTISSARPPASSSWATN